MEKIVGALIFFNHILGSYQLRASGPGVPQRHSLVKIDCRLESWDSPDHGVFWFRQKKDISLESILFLSPTNRKTLADIKFQKFDAKKSSGFMLEINDFDDKDQGTYYCMINKNSVLYFSNGFDLYYLAATTKKPTTTQATHLKTQTPKENSCDCKSVNPGDGQQVIYKSNSLNVAQINKFVTVKHVGVCLLADLWL
ncbi:T-cell surface glycoprotein CD8 alpha chain [Bombina bombina]|uniref:T-cell surface glycoprotein CD8 alpha chain n=1 Tax=Bombina bombina TaxID=8345 RepID=UPI00235AC8A4|nr:T-cell surface glycoprotein CD8 alpha chain [Bombina bombina]